MTKDWLSMTASALGRGIEAGNIDPVELMEMYIETAKNHQFSDKIFARFTESRALNESESSRARARKGTRKSLLDGVPISWKDLFDTAGVATEGGSLLLEKRIPEFDADVLDGRIVFDNQWFFHIGFLALRFEIDSHEAEAVVDEVLEFV